MGSISKRCLRFCAALLAAWLGLRLVLPLMYPFLLGALLALGAEGAADFLERKLRLPRFLAAGLAVGALVAGLGGLLLLLAALAVSQLGGVCEGLPSIAATVRSGLALLENRLLSLGSSLPGYRQAITGLFSDGEELITRVGRLVLGRAGAILTRLPGQTLSLGTALLSGFMICAKLPSIRTRLRARRADPRLEALQKALGKLKNTGKLYLCSQLKLMGVTFCLLFAGFSLLRVGYPLLIALLVTLVDALPVLGTGSVLIPWALVCFLEGSAARALGLLGLYATAALTRSVLEPKLVGSHLGLDPLVTLMAMYCGLRLWGLGGMLLLPMLAAAVFTSPLLGEGGTPQA